MFAWAPLPPAFREHGSLAFSKLLLEHANVAVSPGVGFGDFGENYVRIALVENRQRLRQATRNIKQFLSGRSLGGNSFAPDRPRSVAPALPGE
jgi:alanine-synthesizing transaminase